MTQTFEQWAESEGLDMSVDWTGELTSPVTAWALRGWEAARSAGQEPIYQVRWHEGDPWVDIDGAMYATYADRMHDKRIVYAAPVNGGERPSLEGLSNALLDGRPVIRDVDGWYCHPALPVLDENIDIADFLKPFGIDATWVSMQDGDAVDIERYSGNPDAGCAYWTPAVPAGDGWTILSIHDHEDGPFALFARRAGAENKHAADAQQVGGRSLVWDDACVVLKGWLDKSGASFDDQCQLFRELAALTSPAKVPDAVMQALDRMSTPLHDSRLSGLTAELDAANIKTIRDYVLSGAVPAKVVGDDQHPDDAAVDRFSVAMKAKLAKKRAQGRGGWDDERICSPDDLACMLVDHVRKGDPVDVGNFAMMLFNRPDAGAALCRAALSADGGEESPSLTNPLTPYGMLVRALRITTATTLMDMARYRNVSPSLLSGMEFGRKPVTIDDAIAASEFFSEHGVAGTLGALTVALQAAIAANQARKGE